MDQKSYFPLQKPWVLDIGTAAGIFFMDYSALADEKRKHKTKLGYLLTIHFLLLEFMN